MPEVQHFSTYFIAHNTRGLDIKEERNIVRLAGKTPSPTRSCCEEVYIFL